MARNNLLFTRSDCRFSAWMGAATTVVVILLLVAGYLGFFYKNSQAGSTSAVYVEIAKNMPVPENCEQYYVKAQKSLDSAEKRHMGWPDSYQRSQSLNAMYMSCRERNRH